MGDVNKHLHPPIKLFPPLPIFSELIAHYHPPATRKQTVVKRTTLPSTYYRKCHLHTLPQPTPQTLRHTRALVPSPLPHIPAQKCLWVLLSYATRRVSRKHIETNSKRNGCPETLLVQTLTRSRKNCQGISIVGTRGMGSMGKQSQREEKGCHRSSLIGSDGWRGWHGQSHPQNSRLTTYCLSFADPVILENIVINCRKVPLPPTLRTWRARI